MEFTKQEDYTEDLETLKVFAERFEQIYSEKLGLTVFSDFATQNYLGHGANKIFEIAKPKNFVENNYFKNVHRSMLWLYSEINPNGITDSTDIARTYTIHFEVGCQHRKKYARYWYDHTLIKFHGYGRTIDEILKRFEAFINSENFVSLYLK